MARCVRSFRVKVPRTFSKSPVPPVTASTAGVTTVRFTPSGLWDEEAVRSHEGGWGKAFDNLERALAAQCLGLHLNRLDSHGKRVEDLRDLGGVVRM